MRPIRLCLSLFIVSLIMALGLAPTASASASPTYRDVILADDPIMYWRLGESSGTIAYDETANHRDATYVHDPFLGLSGAIVDDPDTSVGFNGFDQLAKWVPDTSYSGSFSVEAWIRLRPGLELGEFTFFDTRTKAAEYSFDFKVSALGVGAQLHLDVGDGFQWLTTGAQNYPFRFKIWYHVVAVATTTEATLYVNGSAIGSFGYFGTPLLFDPAHGVQIGTNTRYDVEWFHGKIDEVAVYDYALSADQVAAHYEAGIGP